MLCFCMFYKAAKLLVRVGRRADSTIKREKGKGACFHLEDLGLGRESRRIIKIQRAWPFSMKRRSEFGVKLINGGISLVNRSSSSQTLPTLLSMSGTRMVLLLLLSLSLSLSLSLFLYARRIREKNFADSLISGMRSFKRDRRRGLKKEIEIYREREREWEINKDREVEKVRTTENENKWRERERKLFSQSQHCSWVRLISSLFSKYIQR